MCMEDVRIGRQSGSSYRTVVIATSDTLVVPYNSKRIALLVAETAGQTVFLTPGQKAVTGVGVPIKDTANQLLLDIQHHGQMVCQEWHGITGAGATVVVIESILDKE